MKDKLTHLLGVARDAYREADNRYRNATVVESRKKTELMKKLADEMAPFIEETKQATIQKDETYQLLCALDYLNYRYVGGEMTQIESLLNLSALTVPNALFLHVEGLIRLEGGQILLTPEGDRIAKALQKIIE